MKSKTPTLPPYNHDRGSIDLRHVRIDLLMAGETHHTDSQVQCLAQSITDHGILVPLLVMVDDPVKGTYQILHGTRRLAAARAARATYLPCIVLKNSEVRKWL